MRARHLQSLLIATLCLAGALPARAEGPAGGVGDVALDTFFRGAVIGLKGTTVRLRYDFADAVQMKDWTEGWPFPSMLERVAGDGDGVDATGGRLNVRGSTGVKHKAEWDGDVLVTCKLHYDGLKDIGGFILAADAPTDYVTYTIAETYFHGWDHKAGGETGMMKFGKQWATIGGASNGFRYLAFRSLKSTPTPGHSIGFGFGRRGPKDVLEITDEFSLDSNEPGNHMGGVIPGFYSIKSSVSFDEVIIEGTLAPRWLAANHVALRIDRPIIDGAGGAATSKVDPAVAALAEAYGKGEEKSPAKLIEIVADAARAQPDRDAATGALKAGPRKALSLGVIDLLYSTELSVRTAGIEIVKGLTGKDYGYAAKAGEQARRSAIRRLNDDLPALLKGG